VLSALAAAGNGPATASVIDAGERVDLSVVRQDARGFAHLLRKTDGGAPATTPVVLALPRSRALITAYLGAFLAGTTFVPVDPGQPAERIAAIVRDSGARRVVSFEARPVWAGDCEVIDPARFLDTTEDRAVENPLDGDHPVYIVYTSGSTGTPKGVLVPRTGLDALLRWNLSAYPLGPDDCVSVTASPGFDASIWEHFVALAAGVSIHVPTDDERITPVKLKSTWRTHRVTQAFVAPQIAQKLFSLDWDAEQDSLRRLFCGGDALRIRPLPGSPFTVVNAYGPSECSVVATAGTVEPETPENKDVRPDIGTPLPEIHSLVLDSEHNPVGTGTRGTLWVGGVQVALGYLGNPEETAARFRDGAEFGVPGTRFYCTGDVVSENKDGRLVFHGRSDGQVKVDGVRIEVGEVEAVLSRHPRVSQAYVRPVVHPMSGVTRLCATVCGQGGQGGQGGLDRDELRRWARDHLPRHMVPVSFIIRDSLPLTVNGKVDGARIEEEHLDLLVATVRRARDEPGPGEPGRTALESQCARALCLVLGYEVDWGAQLAGTGMTSLMAAEVAGIVSAATGRSVPPRVVLGAATLDELSASVAACGSADEAGAVERVDTRRWSPASPVERSMWFLWKRNPASPEYNIGVSWVFDGALSAVHLESAVRDVLRACPALRITFRESGDGRLEKRARDIDAGDPLDGWYESRGATGVEAALDLAQTWHKRPFDLDGGALARFRLISCGPAASVLQVVVHHSVADGISLRLIADLLRRRYDAAGLEPQPSADDDPYEIWQPGTPTVDGLRGGAARQVARLEPAPRLALGDQDQGGGLVKEYSSHGGIGTQVRELAAERRTSPFRVLLAAWLMELRELLDTDRVTVGVPMHGRVHWQVRQAIGNYANVVPVVFSVAPSDTFDQVLAVVTTELDAAEERMDLPFAQVARAVGSQLPDATDIVDVTFGEQLDLGLTLGELDGVPLEMATGRALFGISAAFRAAGNVVGRVEFRQSAVSEERADALVGRFLGRLAGNGERATGSAGVRSGSVVGAFGDLPQAPVSGSRAEDPAAVLPDATEPRRSEVAAVWCEVLALAVVEPDDDFFELGGDSLHAQMVVARLQESGFRFTIEDFFMNPFLREQQKIVDDLRGQISS